MYKEYYKKPIKYATKVTQKSTINLTAELSWEASKLKSLNR